MLTIFNCKRADLSPDLQRRILFKCVQCNTKFHSAKEFHDHRELCNKCDGNHVFAPIDAHFECCFCGAVSGQAHG